MGKKQGVATNGIEISPARAKRRAKSRKAAEARWAAKSGPVTVTKPERSDD
jgi:hypothetical protein